MRRLLVVVLALAACDHPAQKTDGSVVTAALDKRFAAITDFTLEGTAEQGAEKLPFSYSMKQPSFVRASIGTHTITFDGDAMLVSDTATGASERREMKDIDDAGKLMMLHQAFSRFTCEGWRPPLLRSSGFAVATSKDQWLITVPIDDASLKEQRLVLKAPSAELVEKTIVDKNGVEVTSTKVTEELTDPTTHLVFPKAWESKDQSGLLKIHVDKAVVNGGIARALFRTSPTSPAPQTPQSEQHQ